MLNASGVSVNGLRLWGSPWTPWFGGWAFNFPRLDRCSDIEIAPEHWAQMPADTDILITHGPPFGMLDVPSHGGHQGCRVLARACARIAPKLHVFGHIHESRGECVQGATRFVNAAMGDVRRHPLAVRVEVA